MTPLTFGNPFKFGPDSFHNSKGRPTFLHREREHPKHCAKHTRIHIERGPPKGPHTRGSCHHGGWSNEGAVAAVFPLSRSRLGVNTYSPHSFHTYSSYFYHTYSPCFCHTYSPHFYESWYSFFLPSLFLSLLRIHFLHFIHPLCRTPCLLSGSIFTSVAAPS